MKRFYLPTIAATLFVLAVTSGTAAPVPAGRNIDRYGDVIIQSTHGTTDFVHHKFSINGPNVEVWMSNKTSPVQFHIYCASVTGSWMTVAGKQQAEVMMHGPIRFHVTMKHLAQTQVIDGAAESATYSQAEHTVKLQSGVTATINDDTVFEGPAKIHAAEVDLGTIGNRSLTLQGDASAALVTMNLLGKSKQTYLVSCTGFSTFRFTQPGRVAINGRKTHLDAAGASSSGRSQATMSFTAPAITAAFGAVPVQFKATGGVVADYSWQTGKHLPMKAHVTASDVIYVGDEHLATMSGGVHAESNQADGKGVPTAVTVSKLIMRTINPEKYTLVAEPANSFATFGLGKYGQHALPTGKAGSYGAVTVTGFNEGVLVPGSSARLSGPVLEMVYDGGDTGTHAKLNCKTIYTTFRPDRTLEKLVASDGVTFRWNQTVQSLTSPSGATATIMRTVAGSTESLQVNQTPALPTAAPQQTVILNGPTNATISLPSLQSPVHYTDKAGDRIELNLATQQLDWFTLSHSAKFSATVPVNEPVAKGRTKAGRSK